MKKGKLYVVKVIGVKWGWGGGINFLVISVGMGGWKKYLVRLGWGH